MDELHEASKKTTELQTTIKELESKLAEKDAMIKVLQHSLDRDAIQQSILAQRTNLNKHTRSVSSMGLVNSSANSQTANNLITRNLKNLSIASYSDLASSNSASSRTSGYSTQSNSSSTGSCSVGNETVTKSNIDNIDNHSLKEFDKVLLFF